MEKMEWHIAVVHRAVAVAAFGVLALAIAGCSARLTGADGSQIVGLQIDRQSDLKSSLLPVAPSVVLEQPPSVR